MTPRTISPARWAALTLALVALPLVACGGSDDEGSSPTTDPTEESGGGSGDDAAETSSPDDAAADIDGRALALADLPTGWTQAADEDDADDVEDDQDGEGSGETDADNPLGACLDDDLMPGDIESDAEVERQFEKSEMGPILFQVVASFPDGQAERALEAFTTAVAGCEDFSSTDDDGMETTGSLRPVSYPTYGDETTAARLVFEGTGFMGEGDLVVIRDGNELMVLMGMEMTTIVGGAPFGEGEMEGIVETAVEKAFG